MVFRLGHPAANAAAYGAVWAVLGLVLGVGINMLVAHRAFGYALSHAVPGAVAVGFILAFTNYQQATRK